MLSAKSWAGGLSVVVSLRASCVLSEFFYLLEHAQRARYSWWAHWVCACLLCSLVQVHQLPWTHSVRCVTLSEFIPNHPFSHPDCSFSLSLIWGLVSWYLRRRTQWTQNQKKLVYLKIGSSVDLSERKGSDEWEERKEWDWSKGNENKSEKEVNKSSWKLEGLGSFEDHQQLWHLRLASSGR